MTREPPLEVTVRRSTLLEILADICTYLIEEDHEVAETDESNSVLEVTPNTPNQIDSINTI